jgi:hypothetical protein
MIAKASYPIMLLPVVSLSRPPRVAGIAPSLRKALRTGKAHDGIS